MNLLKTGIVVAAAYGIYKLLTDKDFMDKGLETFENLSSDFADLKDKVVDQASDLKSKVV